MTLKGELHEGCNISKLGFTALYTALEGMLAEHASVIHPHAWDIEENFCWW